MTLKIEVKLLKLSKGFERFFPKKRKNYKYFKSIGISEGNSWLFFRLLFYSA